MWVFLSNSFIAWIQGEFTKFCCLCLWDSRATAQHYVTKNWPTRQDYIPGEHNIKYPPLVQHEKVILPPFHIKLALMKHFLKALDKNGEAFHYIKALFPKISDAKLKEGIVIGPQIRKLLNDNIFEKRLNPQELPAWKSFVSVVKRFFRESQDSKLPSVNRHIAKKLQNNGLPYVIEDPLHTFIFGLLS